MSRHSVFGFSLKAFCLAGIALLCAPLIYAQTPAERQTQSETELLGQGEAMVETLCASCHAIGKADASAHPDAFPLRELSRRMEIEKLRQGFDEGIMADHPDMPNWWFEPQHIDALLAYLKDIQID